VCGVFKYHFYVRDTIMEMEDEFQTISAMWIEEDGAQI
jgi:hypothetical protein